MGLATSLLGTLFVTGALTLNGFDIASGHFRGDVLVFCGAICWVVYSFMGRERVGRLGTYLTTTWAMVFGGLEILLVL